MVNTIDKVYRIANNVLYFDDNSDYQTALYEILTEIHKAKGIEKDEYWEVEEYINENVETTSNQVIKETSKGVSEMLKDEPSGQEICNCGCVDFIISKDRRVKKCMRCTEEYMT